MYRLAWVFIPLFLVAATGAGVLGYLNWYNLTQLEDANARVHQINNQRTELVERLNQAHQETADARRQFIAERDWYNKLADASNGYVQRLNRANQEVESANQTIEAQNREIDKGNLLIAERNDRIAQYIEVNASLENSVTQLDASVRQLESANNSLTRRNRELDQENDELVADYNELVDDYNSLLDENETLASDVNALNARVVSLESQLRRARAQQVTIPTCASNYYTITAGRLTCVARDSSAFQATQTETSTVRLPHSGTVSLKINRSGELGSARSMEILEHAVKTIEEYMGEPIPLKGNEIRLDFVKSIESDGDPAGVFIVKESRMEILEKFDSEPPIRGDDQLSTTIPHEVAHYYWNNERNWLDEGAADFMANYVESQRTGQDITAQSHRPCPVSTISQLEQRKYGKEEAGFACNYSLGEGLFMNLYSELQEEDFQRAFRRLYASGDNKIAGIYQVRQAFYPGSEWVQEIIDKWYGYREKPEAHWPNGTLLGYMTWEESGGWKLQVNRENEPCATILRLNDQTAGTGYTVRQTKDECYYTGEWDENGALIVTIDGKEYRAVEVIISGPPSRYDYSISPGI